MTINSASCSNCAHRGLCGARVVFICPCPGLLWRYAAYGAAYRKSAVIPHRGYHRHIDERICGHLCIEGLPSLDARKRHNAAPFEAVV